MRKTASVALLFIILSALGLFYHQSKSRNETRQKRMQLGSELADFAPPELLEEDPGSWHKRVMHFFLSREHFIYCSILDQEKKPLFMHARLGHKKSGALLNKAARIKDYPRQTRSLALDEKREAFVFRYGNQDKPLSVLLILERLEQRFPAIPLAGGALLILLILFLYTLLQSREEASPDRGQDTELGPDTGSETPPLFRTEHIAEQTAFTRLEPEAELSREPEQKDAKTQQHTENREQDISFKDQPDPEAVIRNLLDSLNSLPDISHSVLLLSSLYSLPGQHFFQTRVLCAKNLESHAACLRQRNETQTSVLRLILTIHNQPFAILKLRTRGFSSQNLHRHIARITEHYTTLLYNSLLYELAIRDSLTNLLSRRSLPVEMQRMIMALKNGSKPLSIAMIDLDHFKRINDEHGHQTGDQVLAETARFIQNSLRSSDRAFRYGGEEILLLLPETELEAAGEVMEKMRKQIHQLTFSCSPQLSVSASFGVASSEGEDPALVTPEKLLKSADSALYSAKRHGRNTVCRTTRASQFNFGAMASNKEKGIAEKSGEASLLTAK